MMLLVMMMMRGRRIAQMIEDDDYFADYDSGIIFALNGEQNLIWF